MDCLEERLDYLQKQLSGLDVRKFPRKLFIILRHSLSYPEDSQVVGAFWCSDMNHFWVNSSILGNTLKIRSNSVNKNLISLNFVISDSFLSFVSDLEKANAVDKRCWKLRYPSGFCFSPFMQINEINLKFENIRIKRNLHDSSALNSHPPLITHDNRDASMLIGSIHKNLVEKNITTWSLFSKKILEFLPIDKLSKTRAVENYVGNIFQKDIIDEHDFFEFCKHYGAPQNAANFISELIDEDGMPQQWFSSSINEGWTWHLTFGRPGVMIVKYYDDRVPNVVIDVGLDGKFSIVTEDAGLITASSISEMLFEHIKLPCLPLLELYFVGDPCQQISQDYINIGNFSIDSSLLG